MKFFSKAADGGKDSGVTGYFLVEIKSLFSIVLLRFNTGTREALHSHAFNAVTLWLKGKVVEHRVRIQLSDEMFWTTSKTYSPGMMKYTSRDNCHQIEALKPSWAISFRGPWVDSWKEIRRGKTTILTHGRKEVL
jgi:hypothetical protein